MIEISQERKERKKKNSWHTRLKLPFQTGGSAQRETNSNRPKKEERKTKKQWVVYLQPSATYLIDDYFYIISFVLDGDGCLSTLCGPLE